MNLLIVLLFLEISDRFMSSSNFKVTDKLYGNRGLKYVNIIYPGISC